MSDRHVLTVHTVPKRLEPGFRSRCSFASLYCTATICCNPKMWVPNLYSCSADKCVCGSNSFGHRDLVVLGWQYRCCPGLSIYFKLSVVIQIEKMWSLCQFQRNKLVRTYQIRLFENWISNPIAPNPTMILLVWQVIQKHVPTVYPIAGSYQTPLL